MPRPFKIVCRGSRLSLAQAEIVRTKLLLLDPETPVELIIKETKGDRNQELPLQQMEGKDFFTQDIHDHLVSGKADFAVHSLKDVSGENFFDGTHYAIIERDDPRDAAIFNEGAIEARHMLRIGTSSPRRTAMAISFLQRALPAKDGQWIDLMAVPIRGNVDTRLQKLTDGEFEGVILACAGLNRLLKSDDGKIADLLQKKRIMILPLIQCPPAPGQGAIVVETTPENLAAVAVLGKLNVSAVAKAVDAERKVAHRYGSGCHQQFGVVHIAAGDHSFVYAAGKDRMNLDFDVCYSMNGEVEITRRATVSVDPKDSLFLEHQVELITRSGKAPTGDKKVWVSETDLWFDLAEKGRWVEGSLEGFGLDFIHQTMESPLANLARTIS